MKILKASAGSGKTYELAQTYINILLSTRDRDVYRHILAVTFTNKATAEMKSRILEYLYEKSSTDTRAREVLTDILHDYSAFSVSTIDRFFQQALKAFSREIGQFSDYQIELDKGSLIAEAMDRILDSLTEEKKDLVEWIKSSVGDQLEQGGRFDMDKGLYEMGTMLKSDEHRKLAEAFGIEDSVEYGKNRLDAIRKECRKIKKDFEDSARDAGIAVVPSEKIKAPGKKVLAASPALTDLFDKPFRNYNTACIIDNLIFSLGLAGEFYREFDALLKEKNIMCLDESNSILRRIIDGSDAPFIYEKLGVRFENFLLDEFQDTSNIQWENFLPLLKESEAGSGTSNLIVGDVKQSIYRWRDSDWELLGFKVREAFPEAKETSMKYNWRSAREVVDFNNDFFTCAAGRMNLSEIYSDVRQEKKTKETQSGSVEVSFCDDQMECVYNSIAKARNAGARWGDIAILVRDNSHGGLVADGLIEKGIPVISDDSLNVKSSSVVRRLVSLLSGIDNPEDEINSFLASSVSVEYPRHYHSLLDLSENLLRSLKEYDAAAFEGETLYIQAFMDDMRSWVETNGNNLRNYLKHWSEIKLAISTPENADSVRIMTIHKSKGLEFPYVIFPFAENVTMYKGGEHWCHFDPAGTQFSDVAAGLYPVNLSGSCTDNFFEKDYDAERRLQAVDNLNTFYVALTRAEKCLHVIAKTPSQACRKAVEAGKDYDWKNMSELLYSFCGGMDNTFRGEVYDFSRMERKSERGEKAFPSSYTSFPLGDRLSPSSDASDFFGEEGLVGAKASPRINGIILHGILSEVSEPSDLRGAVDAAVADGLLAEDDASQAYGLLERRISSHPEWFVAADRVLNETSIIACDGQEYRPDRVVEKDGKVVVIDYKFGAERAAYSGQVRRYTDLYREMGYPDVSGYVWYVRDDRVVEAGAVSAGR